VIRRHVLVSGRVQGVFFRDTCRNLALASDLRGWVRNNPDGTVEAVFEGEPGAVEKLVSWTRRGPADAQVDAVDVRDETPVGEATFRVT
jgi:acylphosphatase